MTCRLAGRTARKGAAGRALWTGAPMNREGEARMREAILIMCRVQVVLQVSCSTDEQMQRHHPVAETLGSATASSFQASE